MEAEVHDMELDVDTLAEAKGRGYRVFEEVFVTNYVQFHFVTPSGDRSVTYRGMTQLAEDLKRSMEARK